MDKKEHIELLVRKALSGQISSQEMKILSSWYDQDEDQPGLSAPSADQVKQRMFKKIQADKKALTRKLGQTYRWAGMAAAIALLVISGIIFYAYQPVAEKIGTEIAYVQHTAPQGRRAQFILPDKSKVWLNAGSTLKHPKEFKGNTREIILKGEAFFEVTHNKHKPFIVHTGEIRTTVLGTSFNVRAFAKYAVEVTVATGLVKVEQQAVHGDPAAGGNSKMVLLRPDQQAIFQPADGTLTKHDVNIDPYLAWREKTIMFDRVPLSMAALMLERYYNVKIDIKNEALKDCTITGRHKAKSLESVLMAMQHVLGFDYKFIDKSNVEIIGKGCK